MSVQKWQAIGVSLFGLFLVFVSLYAASDTLPQTVTIGTAIWALLKTIGITLFGFGFFTIIIETREWQQYFEKRLQHIVIEQSYLKTLDPDILNSLQTNVLKALFRDPNIDREGSFLNYFHATLHKYIAEPYREDVTCEILCEEEEGAFRVLDKVTY